MIVRAVALSDIEAIAVEDLPEELRVGTLREDVQDGRLGLEDAVARFEREMIREALEHESWNQTLAARGLGISRRQLKLKMDRYELEKPI